MSYMVNHPGLVSVLCFVLMACSALLGVAFSRRRIPSQEDNGGLGLVVAATLTLLGLIIGFTFSMASTRYEQRRLFEENEASAIGTEFLRADLLPGQQPANVKRLLRQYLETRITFYQADYGTQLAMINNKTSNLQTGLWQSVQPAATDPNSIAALVISGMNDVLNTQGYTQFAWWNRIPPAAWLLMIAIAVLANILVGYTMQAQNTRKPLLIVLPMVVAVSFFLIADIDSPRGGLIHIEPVDLISLSQSLPAS
jgi:hypothetical protein